MDLDHFLKEITPEGEWVDLWIKMNKTPPKEAPMCRELPQLGEENTLKEIVIVMIIEDHIETKDHLIEEDTPNRGGRPPDRGGHLVEIP